MIGAGFFGRENSNYELIIEKYFNGEKRVQNIIVDKLWITILLLG